MKKVLVTGANGFVGTAICRELSQQGVTVIAIIRNEQEDITDIQGLDHIKIIYCDLMNFDSLPSIVSDRDIDVFYHLAWVGSAGSLRGNEEIQLNNVYAACKTIRACAALDCKRFVFASSIMEYEIQKIMDTEADPGINTLYSSAKVVANYMLRTLASSLKVDYIRAVISNIYGPGEKSPRLINSSLRKLLSGEHCAFSAGEQLYDFIYIDDAARAFVAIGKAGKKNRNYYIGNTSPRPLKEFLIEMRDQVNPDIEIGLGELPFSGITLSYSEFETDAVEKDTGIYPEVSFANGIRKTIEWLQESRGD